MDGLNLNKKQAEQVRDALCAASVLAACTLWIDIGNGNADSAGLSARWSMQIARALNLSYGNDFPMTEPMHEKDSDCTVSEETLLCEVCGVDHSEECPDCGGRGFHKPVCPIMLKESA